MIVEVHEKMIARNMARGGCPCKLHTPCPCPEWVQEVLKEGQCHCGAIVKKDGGEKCK